MAKKNSIGNDYTNNADGFTFVGGIIKRFLTLIGGDIIVTASGSAVITFPSVTCTLPHKISGVLILDDADTGINITAITNEPSTPAAGIIRLYTKKIAGKGVLKIKNEAGQDTPLQSALWQNAVFLWRLTTATGGLWINTAGAGAGTYTTALPTTTNLLTSCKRARYANVVTTTNQVLGQRNTEAIFHRGNAANQG